MVRGGTNVDLWKLGSPLTMNNKKKGSQTPLRHFSWSENDVKTSDQIFAESTIHEWYDAKHRKSADEEIKFINDICLKTCPYCCSNNVKKNGHTKNGLQRFICSHCGKRFNALTMTIFDSKKIPISEWIEFLLHLFEFHSIRSSSFDNRNAESTGRFWLKKVFLVLKDIQKDIVLDGTVYIDEIFFSVIQKDKYKIGEKELRGISRNKICVATATNLVTSFMIVTGGNKLKETDTLTTYGKHIKVGSKIIHDKEKAHNILIEQLSLSHTAYKSKDLKKLDDKHNPLYPINHLHFLMNKFMSSHGGYSREELQDWLNLLWFILNGPNDKYDKVLLFIKIALQIRKRIRFRE